MTADIPGTEGTRVALFNLNPGEVRHEFFLSCLELVVADSRGPRLLAGVYPRISGGNLGIHRNEAVEFFYNDLPFDWLWFVDSDIQLTSDTLDKLMEVADERTAPVVSGLYVNVSIDGNIIPMAYRYEPGTGTNFAPIDAHDIIDNDTLNVDGVGAGCLLIHRSVITRMIERYGWPAPCFQNDIVAGVINGEDFTFCLRCRELGIPIVSVNTVDLTHIKPHGITKAHLPIKETTNA